MGYWNLKTVWMPQSLQREAKQRRRQNVQTGQGLAIWLMLEWESRVPPGMRNMFFGVNCVSRVHALHVGVCVVHEIRLSVQVHVCASSDLFQLRCCMWRTLWAVFQIFRKLTRETTEADRSK